MDAVTTPPVPVNEPVRQYPPGSHDRAVLESRIKELASGQAELTMTIAGNRRMGGGEPVSVVQPHNHRHVLGRLGNATDADVAAAINAAPRRPGLARAVVRRPGGDPAQGGGPAGRTVPADDERRHDPGPVQVAVPGRDRRCLRADRLLAVQRPLRPAAAGRAARIGRRAAGTGWSTARSRASCWRSRRSTSPRSPGTCRPRPPCSATPWCGSRRPPSSCRRTS